MSIYRTPILDVQDEAVLALIEAQQHKLRHHVANHPRRWTGLLRRNTIARAIQGSNTIEGYHATMDDVVAAIEDEDPMDATEATWREILGYRNALTYVLQTAQDEFFEFHPQLIKSLHFMMLQHSLEKLPGRWRPGDIYVQKEDSGEIVYEGPDALDVPDLMDELIAYLNQDDGLPVIIKAAMAHLNFTMIHPFKDGNGRMARAMQTLVFARYGTLAPEFSSIEEWLGRNTQSYYQILAETGQGRWNPVNSAHLWIKFCLRAHYQQAATLVRRNDQLSRIYENVEKIQIDRKLNQRTLSLLLDATTGRRVRAARYREEHGLSDVVASRDLKRLVDEGLLVPHGERRGRYYTAAPILLEIRKRFAGGPRAEDPYIIVEKNEAAQGSPQLPL